uniref:integumentary mucin B.1-like n=1 Tax=Pristiophorus japonicus TaxID=55135 RepID=UPI00398F2473
MAGITTTVKATTTGSTTGSTPATTTTKGPTTTPVIAYTTTTGISTTLKATTTRSTTGSTPVTTTTKGTTTTPNIAGSTTSEGITTTVKATTTGSTTGSTPEVTTTTKGTTTTTNIAGTTTTEGISTTVKATTAGSATGSTLEVTTTTRVPTTTTLSTGSSTTEVVVCHGEWSRWFNEHTPSSDSPGDYELLDPRNNKHCSSPFDQITIIHCQFVDEPERPISDSPDNVTCDKDTGLTCIVSENDLQESKFCYDYQIRVCCEKQTAMTTTTSSTNMVSVTTTTKGTTTTPNIAGTTTTEGITTTVKATTTGSTTGSTPGCKDYSGRLRHEGETWSHHNNTCIHYRCVDGMIVETKISCSSRPSCAESERKWDEYHCCYTCPLPVQDCKVKPKLLNITKDGCSANVQVESCEGRCNSFAIFDPEINDMKHECQCCRENESETKTANLTCTNGTTKQYMYISVKSCKCKICAINQNTASFT